MRKTKAFTLVELLCVVAIIAMLVAILTPALTRAKVLARRRVCATSLKGIATAGFSYSVDYGGLFPTAPSVAAGGGTNRWSVPIGTYRSSPPDTGKSNVPVSASLFILIREARVQAASFLCPELNGTTADTGTAAAGNFDFAGSTSFTYSFLMPYGKPTITSGRGASIAYGADRSPYFEPTTGLRNATAISPNGNSQSPNGNSLSHGGDATSGGEGQNVAYLDCHTIWWDNPQAGLYNDNIYTRAQSNDSQGVNSIGTVVDNDVVENDADSALWP